MTWTPLAPQQPFDPSSPPTCGGQPAEGYALCYCVPEDYVGWDNVEAMPAIYDEGGDYALLSFLPRRRGLA